MKILISGDGAMGQAVLAVAKQKNIEVVGLVGQKSPDNQKSAFCVKKSADCVVDFSCSELLADTAEYCKANKIPLVTGTTDLKEKTQRALDELSKTVAVCQSSNFSVGVLALKKLLQSALVFFEGFDFDIELTEKHHAKKADAPSGTAKALLTEIRTIKKDAVFVFDRRLCGARDKKQVGVSCVRGGSEVGMHTIEFFGEGETLSISHVATDKSIFALGALSVAQKLIGLKNGKYPFEYFFER